MNNSSLKLVSSTNYTVAQERQARMEAILDAPFTMLEDLFELQRLRRMTRQAANSPLADADAGWQEGQPSPGY